MEEETISRTDLDVRVFRKGKVRDMYDLGDTLLMIATDRISAFDSVLPDPIPFKGKVLNQLSAYWFRNTGDIVPNHMLTDDTSEYPPELASFEETLKGRSMIVKKTERIDIECVVRGYISGSAWKEYKDRGTVCGSAFEAGMKQGDRFTEPVFTPAKKSDEGHDVNISVDELESIIGKDLTREIIEKSLRLYEAATKKAAKGGIIIADTKFEYGILEDGLLIIDEILTPDSSRFWPVEDYTPGEGQKSFDKQFIRDYLEESGWNKEPPAPRLPPEVIEKTSERYLEAYRRITGGNIKA